VALLTPDEAFRSKNPKLIEQYLKKQKSELLSLKSTRRKAEWQALRRTKAKLETSKAQVEAVEIDFAAKLSRQEHKLMLKQKAVEGELKHRSTKDVAEYLRSHKSEVSLRSKPYYSRSPYLISPKGAGMMSEEQMMSAYEDTIQQQERISSMRHAYLEIQDQRRNEEKLLNQFFS
jgi:hypothetical protein